MVETAGLCRLEVAFEWSLGRYPETYRELAKGTM
jgi:hypothetical protein